MTCLCQDGLWRRNSREFLAEDVGEGDVTAAAIIPANLMVKAEVIAKAEGIVAGIEEATILAEVHGAQSGSQK